MIQRGIGVTIGAIATLILLLIFGPAGGAVQDYVAPLVIGAIVSFFWPVVIAWWLVRRHRAREQDRMENEVQRQLDQRSK